MAWGSAYCPDFQVASIVGAAAGTTAANDRRLVEGAAGTITFGKSSFDIETTRYSVELGTQGSGANTVSIAKMAATPRYIGVLFRLKIQNFLVATPFVTMPASTAGQSVQLRTDLTSGILAYSFDNGTSWVDSATTLTAATVYRFEVFVDFNTGTTHTLKVRVATGDGAMSEIINTTGGAATSTGGDPLLGWSTAIAPSLYVYSDIVTYNDVAQYATMDDWRVLACEPTADGTHSVGAGTFQTEAAAAITNGTTDAWNHCNLYPPVGATKRVQQTVDDANGYVEVQLRALPQGYGTPVLVCLAAAMYPSTTGANLSQFRLNSGGNISTETPVDTSIAATTLEYRKHHYATEPVSGAAWTVTMGLAPLRARVGYTTLIPATGAWASVMAFVVAPVSRSFTPSPPRPMIRNI